MIFIKLETISSDDYGPIYVYINVNSITSVSKYKNLTNIYLTDGTHYVVKESPTEIFHKIDEFLPPLTYVSF